MRIILGSQSPRRREIMSHFDLPFEQIPSTFDEDAHPFNGDPIAYVAELSRGKALDLHRKYPDATIITADTVVYKNGKIYGKPKDKAEAATNLAELADSWHSVYTAVSLFRGHEAYEKVEESRVQFNPLTHKEIDIYLERTNWKDKAGGYAIQMPGGLIVRRIEGCYYNVMGFPINTLRTLFVNIGIDLWEHLRKQ